MVIEDIHSEVFCKILWFSFCVFFIFVFFENHFIYRRFSKLEACYRNTYFCMVWSCRHLCLLLVFYNTVIQWIGD